VAEPRAPRSAVLRPSVRLRSTRLLVAGNRFYGGQCAVAWPTASHNRVVQKPRPAGQVDRRILKRPDPRFKLPRRRLRKNVPLRPGVGQPEFVNVGAARRRRPGSLSAMHVRYRGNRKPDYRRETAGLPGRSESRGHWQRTMRITSTTSDQRPRCQAWRSWTPRVDGREKRSIAPDDVARTPDTLDN